MTNEDFDLLYWHAVNMMRQGSFRTASQYFRYCFEERRDFYIGLGHVYCLVRDGQLSEAQHALRHLAPHVGSDRQRRLFDRMERRLS